MKDFINKMIKSAHHFTVTDFAAFKLCLLSIGILLGSYFTHFFMQYTLIIWVVGVISLVWLINQMIQYHRRYGK